MGIDKITDQQGYLVINLDGAVLAVSKKSSKSLRLKFNCHDALPRSILFKFLFPGNTNDFLSTFIGILLYEF